MTDPDKADDPATLSPAIQDHIGASLRAMYNEVVSAPVPDRFFALLEALDRGAPASPADAAAGVGSDASEPASHAGERS